MKKFKKLILLEIKDRFIDKIPSLDDNQKKEIKNFFRKKPNLENRIDWNKWKSLTYKDFDNLINSETKTSKTKKVKKLGISGLEKNKDYLIFPIDNIQAYIPLNYEASKLIASDKIGNCIGKWCTAYSKTSEYWIEYTEEDNVVLVYIITEDTKYAVAIIATDLIISEIRDTNDKSMEISELNKILNIDIESSINKNKSLIKKANEIMNHLDLTKPYKVKDRNELIKIIRKVPIDANLNNLDVSNVTSMSYMFMNSKFNGDISNWDVSSVENMGFMFENSQFNGDISNWDVSSVTGMSYMFFNSEFNGDISNWNVSNVENMYGVFAGSKFTGDISNWDVSNVETMNNMFKSSEFNGDISNWNVNNVMNMNNMFENSELEKQNKIPSWYKG